jgi:hypothetical protein
VYVYIFFAKEVSIHDDHATSSDIVQDSNVVQELPKSETNETSIQEVSDGDQNIPPDRNGLSLPPNEKINIPEPDRFVGTDEEHIAHMNNRVKQSMIDRNVPKHRALAILEMTHGEDSPEGSSLNEWLRVYDGTLYTPPYEFDFNEPKNDYTTIPFAIHSYWYAMNSGRVTSLLKHCDETFREDLVSYFKIDPKKQKSYTSENSSFSVLLSGSTKIDGVTYYVCMYTRRRRNQPQDAILDYYEHHFIKKGDDFYFTGDPQFTKFGMVFDHFVGSDPLNFGKFSKLVPELRKNGMPVELLPSNLSD